MKAKIIIFTVLMAGIITGLFMINDGINNHQKQLAERDNIIAALSDRWTNCTDTEQRGFISIMIATHKLEFEDIDGRKAEIFLGPHKIIYKGDLLPDESAQMFFEAFGRYVNEKR